MAGKYRAYLEYRDSGVEWLGEVPIDWRVTKIGFMTLKIGSGKTPKGGSEIYSDSGVLFLRSQNIYDSGLQLGENEVVYISEAIDQDMSGTRVIPGDILLNITGVSIGRSCIVPAVFVAANVNQHVCIIRIPAEHRYFVSLFLKSSEAKAQIDAAQNGAAREGLNFDQISKICLSIPVSEMEMQSIVRFLDYETAKIDTLIEKQQQLIKLLKEKRQAVISHAVTKGLNPNVPMKDSGVEWLGEVPAHWGVAKLRNIGRCQNGINIGAEYFGSGYPFVSYGDVYKNESLPEKVSGLVESTVEDRLAYSVECGDVFFTRTSETIEEIGFASTCLKTIEDASFAGFLIRFRPIEMTLVENFSKYYFRNKLLRAFFIKEMNLVTRASLSQDLLKLLSVPIPPLEEQVAISKYLDRQSLVFSRLIGNAEVAVELLQERRTALISAAVTGKIDVRDWKPPTAA